MLQHKNVKLVRYPLEATSEFIKACEKVDENFKPTRRQWKKWQRKEGLAYANK